MEDELDRVGEKNLEKNGELYEFQKNGDFDD